MHRQLEIFFMRKIMRYDNVKPCPFCGCPSVTVKAISGYYRAKCNGCESRTGYGGSEKEALEIIMEVFMYKITATIEKEGGTSTNWTRYSKSKLTKSECEKMLSGKKEAGVSREQKVKLINFNCEKLQSSRIALYSN